jgi:Domain of unknown function (DUF4331)
MSSHRDAPEISDPVAAGDLYAFVSPDKPDTVTLIVNYISLPGPADGPNFSEFDDDVLYQIHIDNDGDGRGNVTYQFRFTTTVGNENTVLYSTGPIESLDSLNWNRRQTYRVTRVDGWRQGTILGAGLTCPPCNVGPLSTPDYPSLAAAAVHDLGGGRAVFAGQRADAFYVDPGSIVDLVDLQRFATAHNHVGLANVPTTRPGVKTTKNLNVHTIALRVPITDLTRGGWRSRGAVDTGMAQAVIGVWTTASRQRVRLWDTSQGDNLDAELFTQVSRLGNPLFNEVIMPIGEKDLWNTLSPFDDKLFANYVAHPELAGLLAARYPGLFPNLDALTRSGQPRTDLLAVFLTGIPDGVVPGFQNFTGAIRADMLRLNTAIPPTTGTPSSYGLLGGDMAGFPNGRRVFDDVVTIELRAMAGVTYVLVDPTFTPDAAVLAVREGLTMDSLDVSYLDHFPYLGVPHSGFTTSATCDRDGRRLRTREGTAHA